MDTKYKSSSFATYSQYISSPIIIFIFLYYMYVVFMGKHLTQDELFYIPFYVPIKNPSKLDLCGSPDAVLNPPASSTHTPIVSFSCK